MTTWTDVTRHTSTWSGARPESLTITNPSFEEPTIDAASWSVYQTKVFPDATWGRYATALAYQGNYILRPVLQLASGKYRGTTWIASDSLILRIGRKYRARTMLHGSGSPAQGTKGTIRMTVSGTGMTTETVERAVEDIGVGWEELDIEFVASVTGVLIKIYSIDDDENTVGKYPFWIDSVSMTNLSEPGWSDIAAGDTGWTDVTRHSTSWTDA